jgi:prolyl-tRNA editing enzyme YbaK/EbsC (Cys-tRNA(Pro) deacylase)
MEPWPEPVERVAAKLRRRRSEASIEELGSRVASAREAAETLGVELADIVKTVIVVCDGKPVAVLSPGGRRVSLEKVARLTGSEQARVATAPEVRRLTGFEPGAVAPFPLPRAFRVYLDRSLLARGRVWAGAGSPRHLLSCSPRELAELAGAQVVDVIGVGG